MTTDRLAVRMACCAVFRMNVLWLNLSSTELQALCTAASWLLLAAIARPEVLVPAADTVHD